MKKSTSIWSQIGLVVIGSVLANGQVLANSTYQLTDPQWTPLIQAGGAIAAMIGSAIIAKKTSESNPDGSSAEKPFIPSNKTGNQTNN